jgi:hypothetical protein
MTSKTDLCNRALQTFGHLTTVTDADLAGNLTNEAIQFNLIYDNFRKKLLRMAPWGCGMVTYNMVYISSVPGTPENTSNPTTLWARGQPSPPWAYEYQYPVDCLRACWVIPSTQTGYAGGVPITTAVTGGAPSFWQGPPVKYAVQSDLFYAVTAATVAAGGTGYAIGDIITLASGATTSPPIGAPVQLRVATLSGSAVATVTVVNQVLGEATPLGGSYFGIQTNPVAQGSTTGNGTGATFNLTQASTATPQRVILCNQEFATLVYVMDVTDPNNFDDQFQDAFVSLLGARLCLALSGEKTMIKGLIDLANAAITEARKSDANEGLTINDVTPDWIRIRGVDFPNNYSGPYLGYDWGGMWPYFG